MAIKFLDETDIASSTKLGAVKIGNGISIAEDGTISSEGSGSASAVLYTAQTLTDEQKAQALANIGGLSKNQGIDNPGKFLGIGADGIVQPMTVKGDKGEKGDKGDPFTYSDFTSAQLEALRGPQGVKGEKGDPGPQGAKGATGAAFTYEDFTPEQLAALKGPKGDNGPKGEQGPQGVKGEKGDPGAQGEQGIQGPKGEKGATGEAGYTPVRGTDYWTAADIATIKGYVDDAILNGSW